MVYNTENIKTIYLKGDIGGGVVTVNSATAITVDTIYDIQSVFDGSNIYLYINDSLVDSDTLSGTITIASEIYFGKYPA